MLDKIGRQRVGTRTINEQEKENIRQGSIREEREQQNRVVPHQPWKLDKERRRQEKIDKWLLIS